MNSIFSRRQVLLKTLTLLFIILIGVQSCKSCMSKDGVRRRRSSKQPEGVPPKSSPETTVTVTTTRLPSVQSLTNSSTNSTDGRPKRQLFREDIPMHRPLTGNHYAQFHGFPHPGRWTGRESSGSSELPPTHEIHGFIPNSDELSELPPPSGHGDAVGPHYKVHGQGNEVVHEYPVQVSPVISLSGQGHMGGPPPHDVHAPPKVHPDQDPERPFLVGHGSNPHHPPDVVIKELNGEPGPTGPGVKHINHHGNHGPDSYEHQGHHHHHNKPFVGWHGPPYMTGAHRIANFLKTWPVLFHKMRLFPFRRYRKRIKHPYPPPHYGPHG